MTTTRHPYTHALQATLDAFPALANRRDTRARKALRLTLDSLEQGNSSQDALEALEAFFRELPAHSRRPCPVSPQSPGIGQK